MVYSTKHYHWSAWESLKNSSSSTMTISSECNTRWYMLFFHVWIVVIASAVIMLAWLTVTWMEEEKKEKRKEGSELLMWPPFFGGGHPYIRTPWLFSGLLNVLKEFKDHRIGGSTATLSAKVMQYTTLQLSEPCWKVVQSIVITDAWS